LAAGADHAVGLRLAVESLVMPNKPRGHGERCQRLDPWTCRSRGRSDSFRTVRFPMLEPYAGKQARTVLWGESDDNAAHLPDRQSR
jgi:hypothetical protein